MDVNRAALPAAGGLQLLQREEMFRKYRPEKESKEKGGGEAATGALSK